MAAPNPPLYFIRFGRTSQGVKIRIIYITGSHWNRWKPRGALGEGHTREGRLQFVYGIEFELNLFPNLTSCC